MKGESEVRRLKVGKMTVEEDVRKNNEGSKGRA